jgi:NAD(P)-dependent dehydrogenase (short-subunit alcohol dehydrogenase family)
MMNQLNSKFPNKCFFVEADVSKVTDCEKMVKMTVEKFGKLTTLVCSAGIMLEKNCVGILVYFYLFFIFIFIVFFHVIDTTEEDYDRLMSVNTKGVFFSCKYALIQFNKQGKGSGNIVIVASVNSFYGEPGIAACMCKKMNSIKFQNALIYVFLAKKFRLYFKRSNLSINQSTCNRMWK